MRLPRLAARRSSEHRYAVVSPARDAAGRRAYSHADVERLTAIAQLAANGERVADLAQLSASQLHNRLRLHSGSQRTVPEIVRVAVVHPAGSPALAGLVPGATTRIAVVSEATKPALLDPVPGIDAVVVDLEALGDDPGSTLKALQDRVQTRCVLVVFHFASRSERRLLEAPGVRLVRGPTSTHQLRRIVFDHVLECGDRTRKGVDENGVPEALFSRSALERILNITPDLVCECPNHLASLAIAMREFELYSLRCESNSPADARLHSDLAQATGRMRATLEKLVVRVCEHDGISIDF